MKKRILPIVNIMLLCFATTGNATIYDHKNELPSAIYNDFDEYTKSDVNFKAYKTRSHKGTSKGECIYNSVKSPPECINPNGFYFKLNNSFGTIFNRNDNHNRVVSPYDNIAQNYNSEFVLKKEDIEMVQDALNKLGYNAGKIDGLAHNKTVNAIVELQKKEGLPITGEIDQQLLEFLEIR